MPQRPGSWRDIPALNPAVGARLNGRSLGTWRSVAPSRSTSTRGRSGTSDGRGQPNDLERIVAERAIERGDDKGLNIFNMGGKLLIGALDALDTPRAAVVSGLNEAQQAMQGTPGEQASFSEFVEGTRRNITAGEVLYGESADEAQGLNLPVLGEVGTGFALDVALDPLTYVGGGLAKTGAEAGAPAARELLKPATKKFLGEQAAEQYVRRGGKFPTPKARDLFIEQQGDVLASRGAQKALKFRSNQALNELEREAIGSIPGTFLNIPGRRLGIDDLVERLAPSRVVDSRYGRKAFQVSRREAGLGRLAGKARAKATQGRVGNWAARGFTKYPDLREAIIKGTPEQAAKAFMGLEKRGMGNLQQRLFEQEWGTKMSNLLSRAKKAGVDGTDLRYAVAEQIGGEAAGPSMARVLAQAAKRGDDTLAEDLKAFFPQIQDAANRIDPDLPWLMKRDDYTPNLPSDEMIAMRGGWGNGGTLRRDVFDFRQQYGLGPDQTKFLFGQELKDPTGVGGKSVRQQIDDILTEQGLPNWFEQDAYKAFPDYVRRISRRYGDEFMAKELRDLGIFEASWQKRLSEKGMTQGRAKAFIFQMTERAKIRAEKARARAVFAREQADLAAEGTEAAEAKVTRTEQATKESEAIREYEAVLREESATLGARREALLQNIEAVDDDLFRLDHAQVELAHKIKMETYEATSRVTKLETRLGELRDELGRIFDEMAMFDEGFGDPGIAKQATKTMAYAENRATEIMAEMRRIDDVLHQFEDLANMPTDQLDNQLLRVDTKLNPLVEEYDALLRSGQDATEVGNKIQALSDTKASILHEKGVIERARGRVADLDRSNPELLIQELEDVRRAEDMADKLVHTIFPDLPEDINGARIRDYFQQRMGDLQQQIDDTDGAILGAYADRDTMRVELSQIRQQRREAQRKLRQVTKEVGPKEKALFEQQEDLLRQAEEAAERALKIDQERWTLFQQMGFGPFRVQDEDVAGRIAEGYLNAMHAKQLRMEAIAVEREANAATARRVQKTWETIGKRNFSKAQEEALVSALKDSFKAVGAVSMTKDAWLVDGLRAATVMQAPGFMRGVLHRYDRVLNVTKAYLLAKPGTILRNMYGGVFNNYLAGGVEVSDYAKTVAFLTGKKLDAKDQVIFEQMRDAGFFVGSGTTLEIERRIGAGTWNPISSDFHGVRFFRQNQERVENLLRGSLAYSTMRAGGTVEDAFARVVKYHFDYDDLSAFERSVMRRIVPFYTWTRKNFPLMLEQIVAQPQKFTRFYQLKNEIERHSPEEQVVPSYFAENMAIRLPFGSGQGQAYMLPDMPFTSLNDVTDPSVVGSQMSPYIKTPIEYAFGQQFFKGIPLKDEYEAAPAWLNGIPGLMQGLDAVGAAQRGSDGKWYMTQKNSYLVEQAIPVYGMARRLFPSEEKYTERVQTSWLSYLFGLGLRTNTPTDRRNESYRRVDDYMEWVDTQKELGYLTEDDKLPRIGQTVNAAYEYVGVPRDDVPR